MEPHQAKDGSPAQAPTAELSVVLCDYRLGDLLDQYLTESTELGMFLEPYERDIAAFDFHHLLQEHSAEESEPAEGYSSIDEAETHIPAASVQNKKPQARAYKIPAGNGGAWSRRVSIKMASKQISSKKGAPPASDACGSKKKNHGKRGKSSSANRKRTGVAIREAGGDQQAASDRRLSKKWTAITDYYRTGAYSLKADGAVTAPGWNGRSQPKQSRAEVKRDYATKAIHVTLSKFFPVWCDLLRPTILLDSDDRAFFYRTDQALWLLMRAGELDDAIRKLLWATLSCCKMRAKFAKSERGPHFPCIIGHFRAYCEVPKITDWHAKNEAAVTEFISTPIIKDITKWICRVVQTAFPGVAKRFLESAAWHKDKHHVEPLFGLFWNLCINGMFEGQRRIHCLPHADSKNIVGICVLVIYEIPGKKFNHSKRTWLVLWEAGVIIQLPPWVMAAYPSSLLFHFNVDICDFKFVTTEGEERPTPENSTPLEEGDDEGRGSLVYFNQAAMYQSSETDSLTLKKAVAAGHSGMTDYGADIQAAFEKHGVYKSTQPSTSS